MARAPYVFRVQLLAVAWLQVVLSAHPLSAQSDLGADAAELLVRETWYEGLPLDRAAQIDAEGAVRLVWMLEDPDERIARLCRVFFHELARKGNNPVYAVLPDIISTLSSANDVTAASFKYILRYLIKFIDKEKHTEGLVDKLCHRFHTSDNVAQWRDFAYCLSLLNLSDKGVKKLAELFRCYKDTLTDDEVFASFTTLTNKARKFARVETKTLLDELDAKFAACR